MNNLRKNGYINIEHIIKCYQSHLKKGNENHIKKGMFPIQIRNKYLRASDR